MRVISCDVCIYFHIRWGNPDEDVAISLSYPNVRHSLNVYIFIIYIYPIISHSPIILHIPKGLVNIGYISQDIPTVPWNRPGDGCHLALRWQDRDGLGSCAHRIGLAPGRIVTKKVRLHTIIFIIIIIIITIFDYDCHFLNHHHVCFTIMVNYRYCC